MTRPSDTSPEDVTTVNAQAEADKARLRILARRAARRQYIGVTFSPTAQVMTNELGTFVEGSRFYKVEDF